MRNIGRRRFARSDVDAFVVVAHHTDFVSATWAALRMSDGSYPFLFLPAERLLVAAESQAWPVVREPPVDYMTLPGKRRLGER